MRPGHAASHDSAAGPRREYRMAHHDFPDDFDDISVRSGVRHAIAAVLVGVLLLLTVLALPYLFALEAGWLP